MKKLILYIISTLTVVVVFAANYKSKKAGYFPIDEPEVSTKQNAFNTMMDVVSHQRCVNCHPSDNVPKQGDESKPHHFGIARGENNLGFQATNCNTCHQPENNVYSGVPGAPHWSLAPASMAWQGLTRSEIAQAMLDRTKNGNRSHEELIHHLTEDDLVLWVFQPGTDQEGIPREKPPVSEEDYKAAVKEWFASGAIIPEN